MRKLYAWQTRKAVGEIWRELMISLVGMVSTYPIESKSVVRGSMREDQEMGGVSNSSQ